MPKAKEVEIDDGLEPFERPVPVVDPKDPVPEGMSMVRVLPKGDGEVFTGHYDRSLNAFSKYKRGDHAILPKHVAKTQEDAGLVEIV